MRKLVKLFLATAIMINLFALAFAAVDPEDVLGIWTFDEGTGEDTADLSGNERDGMIAGATDWIDGKSGKAIEFSGGNVAVDHDELMNLETFSMTCWLNVPGPLGTYQMVMGKEAWPNRNYSMWILPDKINLGITDVGGVDQQIQGAVVADGQWHHVAGTYDREFLRVYVDGVQSAQKVLTTEPNVCDAPFMIGAQPPAGGGPVNGIIDEVGLFNVALEEEDVQRIMENGLSPFVTPVKPSGKLCGVWGGLKSAY